MSLYRTTHTATRKLLRSALTRSDNRLPAPPPPDLVKKPGRPRPTPHQDAFTVDKGGFQLIEAGPFGILHGTTGWYNGIRYIYASRWNVCGWFLNDDYALLKRFQAAVPGIMPFKSGKSRRVQRTGQQNDAIATRLIEDRNREMVRQRGISRFSWYGYPASMSA